MTVTWPSVLEARSWNANLRNMMASGGRSPTGRDQRVFSDAGFWDIEINSIRIHLREEAAAFRAMVARLRAGEDILVPLPDMYRPIGVGSNDVVVTLSANAALRATQLSLTVAGMDINAGNYLTIGDRLHLITEIVSGPGSPPLLNQLVSDSAWSDDLPWVDAVAGSAAYVVKILPPLRAAQTSGTAVNFRDLVVRCVIKDPSDGDLDLDLGRLGTPSLNLLESI